MIARLYILHSWLLLLRSSFIAKSQPRASTWPFSRTRICAAVAVGYSSDYDVRKLQQMDTDSHSSTYMVRGLTAVYTLLWCSFIFQVANQENLQSNMAAQPYHYRFVVTIHFSHNEVYL